MKRVCQNLLVPALDAGLQKDRPYQSDFYRAGFNAIPRQAREQDSFDTPPLRILQKSYISQLPGFGGYVGGNGPGGNKSSHGAHPICPY